MQLVLIDNLPTAKTVMDARLAKKRAEKKQASKTIKGKH